MYGLPLCKLTLLLWIISILYSYLPSVCFQSISTQVQEIFSKTNPNQSLNCPIFLKKSILKFSLQKGMIFCTPYKKVSVGLKMYFTIANVVTGLLCTNQEVFQQLIEQSLSVNCSSNLIYCIMHCAGKRHLKKIPKNWVEINPLLLSKSLCLPIHVISPWGKIRLHWSIESRNGNYWISILKKSNSYKSVPDIF